MEFPFWIWFREQAFLIFISHATYGNTHPISQKIKHKEETRTAYLFQQWNKDKFLALEKLSLLSDKMGLNK